MSYSRFSWALNIDNWILNMSLKMLNAQCSSLKKFKDPWARMDSNHRTPKRADLQSAAVGHLATCPLQSDGLRLIVLLSDGDRQTINEPLVGIEPTTYWLQISCSTGWAKVALKVSNIFTLALAKQSSRFNRDALPAELKWHFLQPATALSFSRIFRRSRQ